MLSKEGFAPQVLPAPPPTLVSARTMNSDDFALSLSYSQSVPFSHNPSCSLT